MRKSPGFSTVAILVLGLGFAANLEVFSIVDEFFLKPLPVDRPTELVRLTLQGNGPSAVIPSSILDPLRNEPVFSGVCGFATPRLSADVNGTVRSVTAAAMSGDCFATLGLRTQIGHPFVTSHDRPVADRVAVLSEAFWRSEFGGGDALGKRLELSGDAFTIIGVAERRLSALLRGTALDVIIPISQTPLDFVPSSRGPIFYWSTILARRAPSVSHEQVQARMAVIERQLLEASVPRRYIESQRREYLAQKIAAEPAGAGLDSWLIARFGKPLYAMFGLCGAVLLIAGVNLASLLLARGARRQKETAVRLALGATRAGLVGLFALESSMLVVGGGLFALLLVSWMRPLIVAQAANSFSISLSAGLDLRSAAFLAGLVLLTAVALSLAPLWQSSRLNYGRGIVTSGTRKQKIVLGLQVALTLALVSGAGALTASMRHLDSLILGMKTAGVSQALLAPLTARSATSPAGPQYRDLLHEVETLPGVTSASLADSAPFWRPPRTDEVATAGSARVVAVTERFFETLGIPIVAGESFRATPAGDTTAIVSQSLAKALGAGSVIGRFISVGENPRYQRLRVIGIAANVRFSMANPDEDDSRAVYVDLWQHPDRQRNLVVLAKGGTAAGVRAAVQSRGRDYVQRWMTLEEARNAGLIENRLLAWLAAGFSVLALVLAATGMFGLLSYHVAGRTGEIGLRMALGAERAQIRWLIARQILPVMIAGAVSGLALAFAAGKVMSGLVFGIPASDPILLGLALVILALTAALAAWIPARRASAVDPLVALRHE